MYFAVYEFITVFLTKTNHLLFWQKIFGYHHFFIAKPSALNITFYSKGEGNLTVVQELNVKNKEETYYSKTTFKYDDYKFVYYEFESEQKETDGDVEKQHRTESLKYKASFINKYR